MELIDSVFTVVRQISDNNIDDINKLHDKAKNDVVTYHTEMKGFKGLYAKLNNSWLLQLVLIFAVPFIVTYLLTYKQKIMNQSLRKSDVDFDESEEYDDDDERALFEELRSKYE